LKILKQIFAFAHERDLIKKNPTLQVKAPRLVEPEARVITQEEFARILGASPGWIKPLCLILLGTGLRSSEALALRYRDWNAINGTLRIESSSGKHERIVPLNALARHALESIRQPGATPSSKIFAGKHFTQGNASQTFLRACRSVGVEASLRHLRHTSANLLADRGIKMDVITAFLGVRDFSSAAKYLKKSKLADAVQVIDHRMISLASPRSRRTA
jgi:integrase